MNGQKVFARFLCMIVMAACLGLAACGGTSSSGGSSAGPVAASNSPVWPQWGATSQHTGAVAVDGQLPRRKLADVVYDPFVEQEKAENAPVFGSALTVHEQSPITDGNDVYMVMMMGTYNSCSPAGAWVKGAACGPNTWDSLDWCEVRFTWIGGQLVQQWSFDKRLETRANGFGLSDWEPVFHPADANNFLYVPGAGGTVWKVDKDNGKSVSHINPFSGMAAVVSGNTYVSGPLSADATGNIYYNAIQFADPSLGDPWFQNDVVGSWLVKIAVSDVSTVVSYASLLPQAPAGTSVTCPGTFFSLNDGGASLPWPPANFVGTSQTASEQICGSQRPAINLAPAFATDGTVYTVSRAHFNSAQGYLVSVNPLTMSANWAAPLQRLLHDGCGAVLPIAASGVATEPNSCRSGAAPGIDPTTNDFGNLQVNDQSSSSPTVLPDGSVLYGALDNYNFSRGHMAHFGAAGNFLGAYNFGWDETPAVWSHGGTFSIVLKDNHYDSSAYCGFRGNPVCAVAPKGPYYITQLNPTLNVEWQFQNTTTDSSHANGFEWCINMPAIDKSGNVYVNSEDGSLYVLPQGNLGIFTQPAGIIFLDQALGAAYTPLSVGKDGKLYTQNNGHLIVAGN